MTNPDFPGEQHDQVFSCTVRKLSQPLGLSPNHPIDRYAVVPRGMHTHIANTSALYKSRKSITRPLISEEGVSGIKQSFAPPSYRDLTQGCSVVTGKPTPDHVHSLVVQCDLLFPLILGNKPTSMAKPTFFGALVTTGVHCVSCHVAKANNT